MELKFECPACGQHLSATVGQIGVTAPCPKCNGAVTVPQTSTLPHPTPASLVRFSCANCGQHISASRTLIGFTAPCPKCRAAVTVPKTSTLLHSTSAPLIRFTCANCGQHISALRAQIGITAPCPQCDAAITIPKTSTLPVRPRAIEFPEKKRYETTVILIDHCAGAAPARTKKLKKWTDDFTDARNWLTHQLAMLRGDQYFAGIFDHKEKKSVFKEKARIES